MLLLPNIVQYEFKSDANTLFFANFASAKVEILIRRNTNNGITAARNCQYCNRENKRFAGVYISGDALGYILAGNGISASYKILCSTELSAKQIKLINEYRRKYNIYLDIGDVVEMKPFKLTSDHMNVNNFKNHALERIAQRLGINRKQFQRP